VSLQPQEAYANYARVFRSRHTSGMLMAVSPFGTGTSHSPKLVLDYRLGEPVDPSSVSGRVFVDDNHNADYDDGEAGVAGVTLELTAYDESQGYQTTGADGVYIFSDLRPGPYTVALQESSLPAEYSLSSRRMRDVRLGVGEHTTDLDFPVRTHPTPTPTGSPTPSTLDLVAAGIEWIQVVHGEPLIEGKRTLARAYVATEGTTRAVYDVTARLYHCTGACTDWIAPVAPADLIATDDPWATRTW